MSHVLNNMKCQPHNSLTIFLCTPITKFSNLSVARDPSEEIVLAMLTLLGLREWLGDLGKVVEFPCGGCPLSL